MQNIMRTSAILTFTFIVVASTAFADEKLPVLKVGSNTYSNVTVTEVTTTDIYFISDKGLANVKLKDLDPMMQKHFHYDPEAAKQNQQTENVQYNSQVISADMPPNVADIKARMNAAISRVKEIVNQPVTALPRTPDMQVTICSPGWFHPGAEKPDFNTVDIRTTQRFPYHTREYVTSDLNPNIVYISHELEFNPMTKYFYTDRTVPKKRLTEDQMLEINQLYRVIGKCEQQLDKPQNQMPAIAIPVWAGAHKPTVFAIVVGLFITLLFLRRRQSAESD